jgi:hypothetical protein
MRAMNPAATKKRKQMKTKKAISVKAMKSAVLAVQPDATTQQMAMLRGHYFCRRPLSTRQLAILGGYSSYSAGNLQYGNLAKAIALELGVAKNGDWIHTIATSRVGRNEYGECQWRMDEVTMRALEQIFEGKKAKI